MLVLLAAC